MQYRNWNGHALSALGAAVAIVAAAPALAQNTTAAIGGRVTTAAGQPVAGAAVTIVHRESGSTSNLVSDADGRYSVRGLRVGGPYDVNVAKGNERSQRRDLYLALAETLSLDIALGSQQLEAVVVTGSSSSKFSESSMGAGTQIGRQELDAYASISRSLQDYARMDPRLAQTDKDRGEISAAGQNSRFNSITIDGVTTNDTFGLEANNLPTIKQPISIDAIQSVQVNLSNYDATQKGYTGANINAVTKSGTNELKGSVYYIFRNDSVVGERFDRTRNDFFSFLPFKEDTKGVTLGGPIIKDKLFFFASYEELKSNRAQPEFGPIGSSLTNVAVSQSALNSLAQVAKSQYGIDVGTPNGPAPVTVKDSLVKLDWNISENHRASLRMARTLQDETNFGTYSPTGINLTSWWWNQKKKLDTAVVQWFGDWTPNFSTELKISNRDYNSIPINNSKLPTMALQFTGPAPAGSPAGVNTGSRFVNFGTELSRGYNALDTKTLDAYFGATWVKDDHEVKFGADVSRNKVYNAFFQNTTGNYTFSCQNAYQYNTVPGVTPGSTMNCGTATAAQIDAAVLENFSRGRPSSYQVQVPVAGRTLGDGDARWSLQNAGLFLQDTWTISKDLNVTAAVRLDTIQQNERPELNVAASAALVAGNVSGATVTRNTGGFGYNNSVNADGKKLWQPRLGFNYAIRTADKLKTQLRGGVGLFEGAAMNVWASNPFSNTGLATRVVGCGTQGFAACPTTGIAFSVDPKNQPTNFTGASPAANVDFLDPDFRQPAVWKANLGLDKELPGGYVVTAEWMGTKVDAGIYYKQLNLGGATRLGPDGRELFYTPNAYNPLCWTATGGTTTAGVCGTGAGMRAKALSNAAFNNVTLATSSDKGSGNALTLSLQSPVKNGLGWQLSYTRTSATEVSPLTSSVANSNFNSRAVKNANEDVAANSAYLVRDRFNAAVNYSVALVDKYKTTFGLFYEGRKGKPYSWTFRNDMNGDSVAGNDLLYIPRGPGSGEVIFLNDTAANPAQENLFWSVVDRFKGLRDAKGGVIARNAELSPFVNSFDMRISQQVPGFTAKHKGVISFDILNVGNLLNKNWGHINEIGFSSAGGNRRTFVNYVGINADGKYIYQVNQPDDYAIKQVKGESQWAMQITARYEF